jgi:hypothetical protein
MEKLYKIISETNFNYVGKYQFTEAPDPYGQNHKYMEMVCTYIECETKNRNGRIYPKPLMERVVQKYVQDRMQGPKFRSFGELGHPQGVEINPDRICHYITEMRWDGNIVTGKSKVLPTPMGKTVETILLADGQLGVSTRGLGSLDETFRGDGDLVNEFDLMAVDVVVDPSAPQGWINGICENKQYIIKGNSYVCPEQQLKAEKAFKSLEEAFKSLPKKDVEAYKLKKIKDFLQNLA